MAHKKYKPTSPGLRSRKIVDKSLTVTSSEREKQLCVSLPNKAGKNNTGRITTRFRGGRHKRHYRKIDFKRKYMDISGIIKTIEYDPNRTAYISLVFLENGAKVYILTPNKAKVGDKISYSSEYSDIKPGTTMPISNIPVGTSIYNIELQVGAGAKLVRSAGCYAVITGRQESYVTVKLPSGEVRLIQNQCLVTIGQVSNTDHQNSVLGKAGASRWIGRRGKVRGNAMNACDHPHGGGEGKAPVGQSSPRTPSGKPTLGYKTRKKKKNSSHVVTKRK